jgi:hypothetical protein
MLMRFVSLRFIWAALLLASVASCGGGNSSVTTCSGGALAAAVCSSGGVPTEVALTTPTGPNTTEVIVDKGPTGGFSLGGVANVPYVTVTICPPNTGASVTTACVTIDHVFLDTGSYGLRLFKSSVTNLALPSLKLAADVPNSTPAGTAVECYSFVLGGVWGPVAMADVHVSGETATNIPIQVIDDSVNPALTPPADCVTAAGGSLFNNAGSLQANGILGVGMIPYDCGLACTLPPNPAVLAQYYVCPDSITVNCKPAVVTTPQQVQNPVAHFVPDDGNPQPDDNGTIISLPSLPVDGVGVARGRLVFGIGTRTNNQIGGAKTIFAETNPSSPGYLFFKTTIGQTNFPESYIDSGSNAYFFNDATISQKCAGSAGSASTSNWYCPPVSAPVMMSATLTDSQLQPNTAQVNFSIANADTLFSTSSTAFNNLGGSITPAPQTFVWGLSFFYGRSVYTSIWGKALATNGPWNAF